MRREPLPLRCQHRAEDRAERADPHDRGDRSRAFAGLGEVGGDEPPLQRRRLRAAEHHHADEQQPHPSHLSAERSDRRAARADDERRDQRRPPAAPAAERGERRRHQRRPERERGVARPGEAVVAQQVADEQRQHRNHAGDRRLARHLRQAQRRDGATLQRGTINRGVGQAHPSGLAHRDPSEQDLEQQRSQEATGVAGVDSGNIFRAALGNDEASPAAAFWPEIDQPVGGLDDVEVVLDDQHGVALIDQPRQHGQQPAHVVEVQAGGRLVEQVDGVTGRALGELGCQLHSLRLATRQRRRRLAEPHVTETDIEQRLHVATDGRLVGEERRRPRRPACRAPRRCSCP